MSPHATTCPFCGASMAYTEVMEIGDILTCTECGGDAEIHAVENGKITLREAGEVIEDIEG